MLCILSLYVVEESSLLCWFIPDLSCGLWSFVSGGVDWDFSKITKACVSGFWGYRVLLLLQFAIGKSGGVYWIIFSHLGLSGG